MCKHVRHEEACERCKAAGGGTCKSRWSWRWTASLAENDQLTDLPGMQIVRGVDALAAKNVDIVARFNESNWPGIIRELAPGLVRAASAADRDHLCRLWAKEHWYQSWTVLLSCPGVRATEYEPPCTNIGGVVAIPCAAIDLTSDPTSAGDVYDATRWFRVTHSQHQPEVCKASRTVHLPAVGSAISVYPTAVGHFVPEQLPNVLLLHAHLPAGVPILVPDSPVAKRYLQPLMTTGQAAAGRFLFQPLRSDGTVVRADTVYTVVNSHFSNVMNGDVGYRTARGFYNPNGPVPLSKRSHVLLIDRSGKASRSIRNARQVIDLLEAKIGEHAKELSGSALKVATWRPSPGNITADVEAFRHAALIVAPHGAGLANILFAAEGTPVVEICYDETRVMVCPAMYGAMAVNLHMPYWVVTGSGGYGTSMHADLRQLSLAVEEALHTVQSLRSTRHGGAGGASGVGGSISSKGVGSTSGGSTHGGDVGDMGSSVAATLRALKLRRCGGAGAAHHGGKSYHRSHHGHGNSSAAHALVGTATTGAATRPLARAVAAASALDHARDSEQPRSHEPPPAKVVAAGSDRGHEAGMHHRVQIMAPATGPPTSAVPSALLISLDELKGLVRATQQDIQEFRQELRELKERVAVTRNNESSHF